MLLPEHLKDENPKAVILKLSQAVEQSASTVVITDLAGTIEYVNPRFNELTGYSRDEVVGKNPRILKSGHTPPELYAELWSTIRSGREWRGEIQNKRKDGSLYWESLTISPLRNEEGAVTHFLGIEEDITPRKEVEAKLERAVAELQRSNKELAQFTSVVSHDLLGPLSNIICGLRLVMDSGEVKSESRTAEILALSSRSADRMQRLVKDLLAYARLGGGEITEGAVDLNKVVDSVRESLSGEIAASGSEFLVGTLPTVKGSFTLLLQLFQNLFSNALKYRSDLPPRIVVSAKESAGQISISVADNGRGIPPEVHRTIFEPFYRAEGALGEPGFGIGLATCKKIVCLHRGKIWVDSENGRGSTFSFTLPQER